MYDAKSFFFDGMSGTLRGSGALYPKLALALKSRLISAGTLRSGALYPKSARALKSRFISAGTLRSGALYP